MQSLQKKEFIIKDNVGFGSWDFDSLANDWDSALLEEWGLDMPNFDFDDIDYGARNQEVDTDEFNDNLQIILNYTFDDYQTVKTKLSEIGNTPEEAIFTLMKNYDKI